MDVVVVIGPGSGIQVQHRRLEPVARRPRAGLGQHVDGRLRRRALGLAHELDRLRRPALAVPVTDRAAPQEDAAGPAELVGVGEDGQPRLDVLTGGGDREPARAVHGVGADMAGREADEVTWRQLRSPAGSRSTGAPVITYSHSSIPWW